MKRTFILIMVIAMATVLVTACGGGGGGSKKLGSGGFIKTVALGIDSPWLAPFTTAAADHEQHLFLSQDINGSGNIESISFRYEDNEPASINCPDVTIMMGHTSLSALTLTYANNVEQGRGSLDTVKSGALTAPAGSTGDYFSITLDTLFNYNGVDNLVVEFSRTEACDGDIRLQATGAVYTDVGLHKWNNVDIAGDLYDNYLNAKFNFAGGDNTLDYGGSSANSWPFSTGTPKIQTLHLASDIDGSGPVTGIAFQLESTSNANTYTYSVAIGHTTLSALASTFADNFDAGTPSTVANAASFNIPAGITAGEWFWVPLPDGTFTYNGSDNLLVEIEVTGGIGSVTLDRDVRAGSRVWANVGDDVGTVGDTLYHLKLRFNGGPMDVITDGGSNTFILPVGNTSEYIAQILYDNTALGTSGKVIELGFRLGADSLAFDHSDINLVLGHTTLSSLGPASLAANIESDLTVAFTGTISIPSGLEAGDWVTVPLTTPFNYDSTKNLVVQWDAPAYAIQNDSIGNNSDPTRYNNHTMGNLADRTSDVGTISGDYVIDLSLTLDK